MRRFQSLAARMAVIVAALTTCMQSAQADGFETIKFPGAAITAAYGVNSSGQVVGAFNPFSSGGTFRPFLFDEEDYREIIIPDSRGGRDRSRSARSRGRRPDRGRPRPERRKMARLACGMTARGRRAGPAQRSNRGERAQRGHDG